jgi:hypothetical protein
VELKRGDRHPFSYDVFRRKSIIKGYRFLVAATSVSGEQAQEYQNEEQYGTISSKQIHPFTHNVILLSQI